MTMLLLPNKVFHSARITLYTKHGQGRMQEMIFEEAKIYVGVYLKYLSRGT